MGEKYFSICMGLAAGVMGIILTFQPYAMGEDQPKSVPTKTEVKVLEGYISSDTIGRSLQTGKDNVPVFYNEAGKIFAVSKLSKSPGKTRLKHLWFLRDQIILDAKVAVNEDQNKAVSGLILKPNWTGRWRVDVTADDGTLLYSIPFVIQKRSPAEQAQADPANLNPEPGIGAIHSSGFSPTLPQ